MPTQAPHQHLEFLCVYASAKDAAVDTTQLLRSFHQEREARAMFKFFATRTPRLKTLHLGMTLPFNDVPNWGYAAEKAKNDELAVPSVEVRTQKQKRIKF